MTKNRLGVLCGAAFLCLGAAIFSLYAQAPYAVGTHYARGQDVSPTFEGWEGNPDGTFTLYFGYYNRNAEEEVDAPLGAANHFDGDPDQGQPTHFYTGRRWFVFKKVVPKTWTLNDRLTWTLTTHGKTNVSKGWIQPEWEIDKALITKNSPGDPFLRITNSTPNPNNKPPEITASVTAMMGRPTGFTPSSVTLTANATDDGLPKPGAPGRGGRPQGLQIRWITYRGPAKAVIEPEVSPAVYGKPLAFEATATFSEPGAYRLRAIATDGSLFTTADVDIEVKSEKK
jgi:hypothetical protein